MFVVERKTVSSLRKNDKKYNIAIIGATGNAGMETIKILEERAFPVNSIQFVASSRSVGRFIQFANINHKVKSIDDVDFSKIDIAFFCAGSTVSKKYAEYASSKGCIAIDKTSYFRLDPKVPLIVPEVNGNEIKKIKKGIVSTPNCVAVPLSLSFNAISNVAPIKRAVISTYQSVSGAGKAAIDELYNQTKQEIMSFLGANNDSDNSNDNVFSKKIAFNVIPCVGTIMRNGTTDEEDKISTEMCKILQQDLKIAVTCVRVPVFIGHSISVACEMKNSFDIKDVYDAFNASDGIDVVDKIDDSVEFATPRDIQGKDNIAISRIRIDHSVKNGVMFWVTSDNLRKGAALNAIQIAELIINTDATLNLFKNKQLS